MNMPATVSIAFVAYACSSSPPDDKESSPSTGVPDNPTPAATASSSGDGGPAARDAGAHDPNANCVKPGTPNNDVGVGGYCEPNTSDCETPQGTRICTAGYAPPEAWFCTMLCLDDSECGAGA